MKKKFLGIMMVTVLTMAVLVGCGANENSNQNVQENDNSSALSDENNKDENINVSEDKNEPENDGASYEVTVSGVTFPIGLKQSEFVKMAEGNGWTVSYDGEDVDGISTPDGEVKVYLTRDEDGKEKEIYGLHFAYYNYDFSKISLMNMGNDEILNLMNNPSAEQWTESQYEVELAENVRLSVSYKDAEVHYIAVSRVLYGER